MNKKYYIAYGSNLNMAQMTYRCPTAEPIGTATIKDYELLYKGSKTGSYATIEPKEGAMVPVGIWSIQQRDEERLDIYEGYPGFYYKKDMKVEVTSLEGEDLGELEAMVYIMHEEREFGTPSMRYIYTIIDGYQDFGIDKGPLLESINKINENCNR